GFRGNDQLFSRSRASPASDPRIDEGQEVRRGETASSPAYFCARRQEERLSTSSFIQLMAEQVMVLVAPGTASRWTEPPFSGVIADGFVCGRGSIDDKGTLLSILDA